jgi:uncharacterized protein
MPHPRLPLALVAVLVLLANAAGAEPIARIPNPRTRDGSWVTDVPGALRADTVAELNATIGDLARTTGAEMAVVVIGSLDGLSVEEAAERLFNLWGIGKKDKDNGLLFLWSTGDREVRVEVGYGLEGTLPDGKVGAILDTYVIPFFRAGQFNEGVVAGVNALISAARNEEVALPSQTSESYETRWPSINPSLLNLLGGIPLLIGSIVGFRKWRRFRPRSCPVDGTRMVRLEETEDDAALEKGQLKEEEIDSVDYDVWKCPVCAHQLTLRYPKWLSTFDECPQCQNRTKSSTETVIEAATTSSSGSAQVVELCAFCSFRHEFTKTLPRITQSSSSSGSSSGSSSSSFGGGSSGGGGASRGY